MMSLADAVEAFLRGREVAGVTQATLRIYAFTLNRFLHASATQVLSEVTSEGIEHHLGDLRARMKPVSVHQSFRVLRTFCKWCVRTGRFKADPMDSMTMRIPKTLPRVPDDEDVHRLLEACPNTFEGRRNRALIALAADSGLRREELRRLRVGDLDLSRRIVHVRAGKGQKDGVTFFGDATASIFRTWLAAHPALHLSSPVFCTRSGAALGRYGIRRILYRLSKRAGLARKIGPHALRHYAATALLRRTGDLDLVRRVLRHESLTMALRYVALAQTEVAAKYQHASPVDNLQNGLKVTRGLAGRSNAVVRQQHGE